MPESIKRYKIAAIIICYHPNEKVLHQNISAFAQHVDTILLWHNSNESINCKSDWDEKVHLLGDGTNRYIAQPLTAVINWCIKNKYDYLLTMDQDSIWQNFKEFISQIIKDDNIAIHSPNVNYCYLTNNQPHDVESVITSGSLLNIKVANKLGGFREDYKIYWVDGEFCYWARKNNYRIIAYPNYHLRQQFGNQTKTLFGYYTSNYSPEIYYYIFRNMLWMHREHGNYAVSIKCILYTSMYNIRGILLGENKKIAKLHNITKAFWDGLVKRIPNPRRQSS